METANIITINTDDKNIVEIIKKIIADEGLTVGELFEDDDIIEYIHDAGISADVVYDEDDILACGCVTDKIEELEQRLCELEDEVLTEEQKEDMQGQAYKDGWKEGWAGRDVFHGRYGDDEDRIEELKRQLAQLKKLKKLKAKKLKAKKCEVEETVDDDTILKGVECRKCGNTLPPHTVRTHLTKDAPILTCPHKTEE